MAQTLQPVGGGYVGEVGSVDQRNRVLRNTYWLLALSMLPTVLGAWIGVSTGALATLGAGMSAIVFLGGAFAFMFAIEKTKNSATGVPVLLAFTFFMGLMLSRMLSFVLGLANGPGLIMMAFAGTGLVFFGMAAALDHHQARPVDDGQVPVHRRHPGAGGQHRQHLDAVGLADDHPLGAGDRHLLGLHHL
jgi:modulator of FtsH protease